MIIGLTGGIGSGKTTVLKMFENLGVAVFVADEEAKKLMVSDIELISQIKKLLGEEAYSNDVLNKAFVATSIFNDKGKLTALNKLVHPKVRRRFHQFVEDSNSEYIVYEAAILFESGSNAVCDLIITVVANIDDRVQRIKKRDLVDEAKVYERIQNQSNDIEKILKSDFVIKNNTLKATNEQVLCIFDLIKNYHN